jgi:UDP-glucose 4-epimerase
MSQADGGPLTWVVGAGGLLGSNVVAHLGDRGDLWSPSAPIGWGRPHAKDELRRHAQAFLADADGMPWQLVWCAGRGVTNTTADELAAEGGVLVETLGVLAELGAGPEGALFVSSSAGGVYAGSHGVQFDEETRPVAISPYGAAKLMIERAARDFHEATGVSVLTGRISNLYGPNQNLGKSQGLISHVCRAQLLGQAISIYVPLDTMRDYLYAADCATLVIDSLERLRTEARLSGPTMRTKVLAANHSVTIGFVIAELGRILKRRPRVVYGVSPSAKFQAKHMHFRSRVWADLDATRATPLPVGMKHTIDRLLTSLQAGLLV